MRRKFRIRSVEFLVLAALSVASFSACSTYDPVAGDRLSLRQVTEEALRDPDTWVPAVGAALVAATDTDREISDWAREETPLFGSAANASQASDDMKGVAEALTYTTIFVTAEPDQYIPRLVGRKLLLSSIRPLTPWIKRETGRERPNGRNFASFPSGHAAQAFAYGSLTRMSLEEADLSPAWKRTISVSSRVLAIGTGWARIEAGEHYPTDVLVSAALSNFLTRVLSNYMGFDSHRLNLSFGDHLGISINLDVSKLFRYRDRQPPGEATGEHAADRQRKLHGSSAESVE